MIDIDHILFPNVKSKEEKERGEGFGRSGRSGGGSSVTLKSSSLLDDVKKRGKDKKSGNCQKVNRHVSCFGIFELVEDDGEEGRDEGGLGTEGWERDVDSFLVYVDGEINAKYYT